MAFYQSYFLVWLSHPLWLRGGCVEGQGGQPTLEIWSLCMQSLKAIWASRSPASRDYPAPSVLLPLPASQRYPLLVPAGSHKPRNVPAVIAARSGSKSRAQS